MGKTAQNGPKWPVVRPVYYPYYPVYHPYYPWYALCCVSIRPKRSVGTSFAIEGGFNPVGRVHKGLRYCFGSFWTHFGLFRPFFLSTCSTSVPRANGYVLRNKGTTDGCRQGFRSPNRSPLDGLTWGYPPTKFWGCPQGRTRDTDIGPPIGPPACSLLACC